MAVTITHTQTRTILASEVFEVTDSINVTENIPLCVFVFDAQSYLFSHVARASDVHAYPETAAEASISGASYYRQAAVTATFTSLDAATNFAAQLNAQLSELCVEFNNRRAGFEGSTNIKVSS